MAVITGIGSYVPQFRLSGTTIARAVGWVNPSMYSKGFKAVASWDEDPVTMGVEAVRDLQKKIGREELLKVKAVLFVSTTAPFQERPAAHIIAAALDLPEEIEALDITDSPNLFLEAIVTAGDKADARGKPVLVIGAEARKGKPGSAADYIYGDGAAAVLVSPKGDGLRIVDHASISKDFVDHWRGQGEVFDRAWEDRWIRDAGFVPFMTEVIKALSSTTKPEILVLPDLYVRDLKRIAKSAGFPVEGIAPPLISEIGYTGNPQPLLLVSQIASQISPHLKVLIAGYGYGGSGVLIQATEGYNPVYFTGIKEQVSQMKELDSYTKYAVSRELCTAEKGIRGESQAPTALSLLYRRRREVFGLVGTRCKVCNTPQFPPQRVCVNPQCRAVDQMEPYRFADLNATVFSFTEDNLAYTPQPPAIYALVDFDGGGRFWFDVADAGPGEVRVGSRVKMVFRLRYIDKDRGLKGYFWKAKLAGGSNG